MPQNRSRSPTHNHINALSIGICIVEQGGAFNAVPLPEKQNILQGGKQMITGYRAKDLNTRLKKLASDFRSEYDSQRTRSEENFKKILAPGQRFTPQNGFYNEEDRLAFSQAAADYRRKAHDILDDAARELSEAASVAPSTDAVNSILLMQGMKNLSAEEIDSAMNRFGQDCPLAYKRLKEIAMDHGYHDFKDHPLGAQAEAVQILEQNIDRTFSGANAEKGSIVALTAGFSAQTDMAFPVPAED